MYPQLTKLQNCTLGLAACYNQTFTEFNMPIHSHDYYEIMCVETGHCEVKVENNRGILNTIILKKNDFIFIDANKKHRLFIEPNNLCAIYNIELNAKKLDGTNKGLFDFYKVISVCGKIKSLLTHRSFIMGHDTNSIKSTVLKIQKAYETFTKSPNDTSDVLIQLLLGQLLLEIDHCCDVNNKLDNIYVQKTYEYIKNHYQENISIDTIAEYLNIHPTYIHKLFKQHVNETVHNVINRFRVRKSLDLLANTAFPLIDIAVEVGFNNRQSYFNAFKKFTDKSPTEYRNAFLNNEKWIIDQSYKSSIFDEY